jgi:hypothetical protein
LVSWKQIVDGLLLLLHCDRVLLGRTGLRSSDIRRPVLLDVQVFLREIPEDLIVDCWMWVFSFKLGVAGTHKFCLDSNSIGWISGFAGVDYATALQIFAAVTIGSGGTFVPTTSQILWVASWFFLWLCSIAFEQTVAYFAVSWYFMLP